MATSSFNKDFTLNTKKAVESFERIISTPKKGIKIDRNLVSAEKDKDIEYFLKNRAILFEKLGKSRTFLF
ncbi:hypothetical protein [Halanaerobium congolense]|jgi:hypothetical protein|uniref:Uncharacterized protein n=1 Tax=Halanaerobium congolense TaxID=54121 RepID=A0A4R7EAG3_9FIRM|nr:hypothetical protein [Halanaerobium congolense]TDS32232.1 hypothetical protein BY453_10825 [Halanaerobium congolense]SDK66641.1 hypothetical protein SAMN04515655_11062 [Halanaerobium congolense]SDM33359.1 hypothetical protein SAMN04488599_10962 [Halanaerobium congolense]